MNKSKIAKTRKKLSKIFSSVAILVIFALPLYATGSWLKVVFFGNETRKVFTPKELAPIGDLDNLAPFKEPLITVTFDDGWESIYSVAYEIMAKYGILSTQYILGDEFKNVLYMSEAQVRSLQNTGHEIASHTMTHPNLTQLSDDDLSYEIRESKAVLEKKFGKIHDFATPLGAYNKDVIEKAKGVYRSHRNTDADPKVVNFLDVNTESHFDRYNIIAYTIRRTTTIEDIQRLIEYTEKNNGWLVLNYHQVDDSDAAFGITAEDFEEHMKLLKSSKSRLPTLGRVLDAIDKREGEK